MKDEKYSSSGGRDMKIRNTQGLVAMDGRSVDTQG